MEYIKVPRIINYKDLEKICSLSPSSYKIFSFKNKNVKSIKELLLEKPLKGQEVGSFSYIKRSKFYFIKTKALQPSYFLPVLNEVECATPILPKVFKDFNLRKGDILISKDANIGETAYLDRDLPNFMISGGLVRLRFSDDIKHYVFAFMKSEFFKSQIDSLVGSRGATIRHAKTLWLDALIPFPNKQNKDDIIKYVSLLTMAVIRKESEIQKKYNIIMQLIDNELRKNQKQTKFIYNFPTLEDLMITGRLDASIYDINFKQELFYIENYKNGTSSLQSLGFKPRRGPNLAVSVIGRSIYSEQPQPNFYTLIEPMDITDFMTVKKLRWIGNKTKIPCLRKGDILFGAEGNIGKVYIVCEEMENAITNYHGMTINVEGEIDITENVFIGTFLSFLKERRFFDKIAVGGQGGSVGKEKLLNLKIPNFPRQKKEEIAKYYYNPVNYKEDKLNLAGFEDEDLQITNSAGIWQLDKQIKKIKQKLDEIIYKIAMDEDDVDISFDFLKN